MYQLEITLNSIFNTYQLEIAIHLHLVSFHTTKCFWKNLGRGKLIQQIIEFESREPGVLVVYIPKIGYFHDKTKIFKSKSSSEWFNF